MSKKKILDSIVIGFALFAMIFGGGSLILPPIIGYYAGIHWPISILGFMISGVFTTFLALLAISLSGDNLLDFGNRIHPKFVSFIAGICMLCLGPFIAIPRIAATTYELGVLPLTTHISPTLSSIIFFILTMALALSAGKVVNILGIILTPILLVILLFLVGKGIIHPLDTSFLYSEDYARAFTIGFKEGYQTMDALAALVMAGLAITAVKAKGYTGDKEKKQVTIISGLIAIVFLGLIYGGLIYLGATSGYHTVGEVHRTELLLYLSQGILGEKSGLILALCVALACLTTSIALTSAVADYFEQISKGKLRYSLLVVGICIISSYFAINGVDQIIYVAYPFLAIIYPIAICMTLFIVFFGSFVKIRSPYLAAVFITFIIAVIKLLVDFNLVQLDLFKKIMSTLPLHQYEIPWLIPALLAFGIQWFWEQKKLHR